MFDNLVVRMVVSLIVARMREVSISNARDDKILQSVANGSQPLEHLR